MENARRFVLPEAARLGTVELGNFRLEKVLGRGSHGTAFLAHQQGIEREAVVKIAHANLLQGRDADRVRARFAAELQAATQVDHPNVVTVFTAGDTSDGLPAIAMEYVRGASLEDVLERRAGRLPAALVHAVFGQLGGAIAAFHSASVIHRDLSPANIILGEGYDGTIVPKVLDFGAARLGVGTGRTSIVGTPRYMAPEQVLGASGPASDVYALGAMLWWALSGAEVQCDVMTLQDVMEARLMGPRRRDIRELVPHVSTDIANLLAEMLDFEPAARPSAEAFCQRWADCAVTEGTSSVGREDPQTVPINVSSSEQGRPVSALDIESFVGLAPELIADILEACEQRRVGDILAACAVLRERAQALGGVELVQLGAACAAFAEAEDFSGAAGFGAELEREYGNLFQRLMTSHTARAQERPLQ